MLDARFPATLLATALLSLLVLGSAGCRSEPEPHSAWSVVDLLGTPPDLPALGQGQPSVRQVPVETLRRRSVQALQTPIGESVGWSVSLGEEPFLTFRPVADGDCVFRVFLGEEDGTWHDVWQGRHVGEAETVRLPPEVEIDLAQWSGRAVEIWLRIAGSGGCRRARWATPQLFSRGPLFPPHGAERPDVLLIGLDTLRTDALGLYGREPSVTPSIDAFGARSDVFLQAFSANNSTNPGFTSLMTGLHSRDHGIYDQRTKVSDSAVTLAELLGRSGYGTRAILSARHLGHASGLEQGFDEFFFPPRQYFAETIVRQAMSWFQADQEDQIARLASEQPSRAPRFTFLHFFDAHIPHNPPAPFDVGEVPAEGPRLPTPAEWFPYREVGPRPLDVQSVVRRLEGHTDVYPGEAAYLDRQLGRLLAFLESRGILDHTLVALVADHGETLGERGQYFDHDSLIDPVVHVPLIVHWPGQAEGRRRAGLVQHLDLFPTLLAAAGVEAPSSQVGRPIPRDPDATPARRLVVSEAASHKGVMVRTAQWKLVEDPNGSVRLYDLAADPGEARDLAGTGLAIESELRSALGRWRADVRPLAPAESVALTPEDEAELRALGYVD